MLKTYMPKIGIKYPKILSTGISKFEFLFLDFHGISAEISNFRFLFFDSFKIPARIFNFEILGKSVSRKQSMPYGRFPSAEFWDWRPALNYARTPADFNIFVGNKLKKYL